MAHSLEDGLTVFPIMELPPKETNSDYELVQYTIYSTVRTRLRAHQVNARLPPSSFDVNVTSTRHYVKSKINIAPNIAIL